MIDIPHKNSLDGVSTIGTKKYGRRAILKLKSSINP
jgi:hypothetical protein